MSLVILARALGAVDAPFGIFAASGAVRMRIRSHTELRVFRSQHGSSIMSPTTRVRALAVAAVAALMGGLGLPSAHASFVSFVTPAGSTAGGQPVAASVD